MRRNVSKLRPLVAAALAVGLTAAALFASSSSAQTSAGPTKFKSKLYGYSLVLPAGRWSLHPATSQWFENQPQPGNPDFDTLTNQVQERFFMLGAQKLPNGVGPGVASWTAYFIPGLLACPKTSPESNTTLGGAPAKTYTFRCFDVVGTAINAVYHGDGYFMILGKHTQEGGAFTASHRTELQTVRRSFHFTR